MNIDLLKEKFDVELVKSENSFEKIRVNKNILCDVLSYIRNNPEYDFERLNTIIAVDLGDSFELIYDLCSKDGNSGRVSVVIDRNSASLPSVVDVYKSAYYDECEIFDLFGIKFENNPDLKRLLLPEGWIGYPLRKDYVQNDERLVWNK